VLFDNFLGEQQVELYRSNSLAYEDLVAIGQSSAATIDLIERNSSGISGSVTWDLAAVAYPSYSILSCGDLSSSSTDRSSSSSSSVDSHSSKSSLSSSSTSSSSSNCCTNPICIGDDCSAFSGWLLNGMTDSNSNGCQLYVIFEYFTPLQQIRIYKDADHSLLVAVGQDIGGLITLSQRNSSGLSGSVTWNGTQIVPMSFAILDCAESSSSSQSQSSLSSRSSNSSSSFSSSTSDSSSSSSRSSLSSSSSSTSSNSSSSSLDSSSSTSESIGNFSSSSSSSKVVWNKIKPLTLAMSSVSGSPVLNRIAQTIPIEFETYDIGKAYCYLYGAYGIDSSFTVYLAAYTSNNDGSPNVLLYSVPLLGSSIDGDGWYEFNLNISGSTPSNKKLSFVLWQDGGDDNNYVLWGYRC
jgi:hypothetical protein